MEAYSEVFGIPYETLVAAIAAVLLAIVYYFLKNRNLPPGPVGVPYLGYWPFLGDQTAHLELDAMKKKYGDVFSITVTGQLYIHLGSVQAIREAHLSKADCFSARPDVFTMLLFTFQEGFLFINGDQWKVMRKFFINAFKEIGITAGKEMTVGTMYDQLHATVQELRTHQDKPVNIMELLTDKCTNVLRRTMFNDDGITREEFAEVIQTFSDLLKRLNVKDFLVTGEFLRLILFPLSSGYKSTLANQKKIESLLYTVIDRRESTFDRNNIRDLVDRYILERNERRAKGDPTAKYFTKRCLMASMIQLVGDGSHTVAAFVSNFLKFAAKYPEEQEKIYRELVDVVGQNRQPAMEDKSRLPYTNAFIYEVLRNAMAFPVFPSLQCTRETTLHGYRIPKGAVTLLSLYSAHNDPGTYEDPQEFRPSRFVATPEKKNEDLPIRFGVGKRACTGEAFTMMQVFLFLTTIIKNFQISLPDETPQSQTKFEICVKERAQA